MYTDTLPTAMIGAARLLAPRRGGVDGALMTRCLVVFTGVCVGPDHDLYLN